MDLKQKDTIDEPEIFLAKRDGVDEVVKTLQYLGMLAHYNLEGKNPILAARYKNLEVQPGCGGRRSGEGERAGWHFEKQNCGHQGAEDDVGDARCRDWREFHTTQEMKVILSEYVRSNKSKCKDLAGTTAFLTVFHQVEVGSRNCVGDST